MNVAVALAAAARGGDSGPVAGGPLTWVVGMAALSLIPFVILLMSSFVRIAVVLSILRGALGTPELPPNQVVTGVALLLTLFVMAPVGERMYHAAGPAAVAGIAAGGSGASVEEFLAAGARAKEPLREFLLKHAGPRDRGLFHGLAMRMRTPAERSGITDRDLMVVVPAFVTSELRRAFEVGFLLFVPFMIIDLVIANVLLALGMHMLSPTTVSLPFKLLLFVVADGWQLLLRGLVESYV